PITITVTKGTGPTQPRAQTPPPSFPDPFEDDDDLFTQLLRRRGLLPNPRGGAKSLPQNDREAFFITVEVDKTKAYVGEQITANWYIYTRNNIQDFDPLKYPQLKGFWKEDLHMTNRLNFSQEIVNGIPYQKPLLVS